MTWHYFFHVRTNYSSFLTLDFSTTTILNLLFFFDFSFFFIFLRSLSFFSFWKQNQNQLFSQIFVNYSSSPFVPPLVFPYQWRRRLRRRWWFWGVELELRSATPTPSSKTKMTWIATMFTRRDVGLMILDQSFCCATSATRDIICFALDPFLFRCPKALGSVLLAPTSRNPNVWFLFPQSMVFFF